MLKICIAFLAVLYCCVQCVPIDSESNSTSTNSLHLIVKNSTEAVNYHLSPIMTELEDIDEEIVKELDTVLPYINFLFDALFGRPNVDQDSECVEDMVIQLVPDNSTSFESDESPEAPVEDVDVPIA